eukprot:752495-Amphidinium_carterae.1
MQVPSLNDQAPSPCLKCVSVSGTSSSQAPSLGSLTVTDRSVCCPTSKRDPGSPSNTCHLAM